MVSVNSIILGGHLGFEPEEKRTSTGKLICNLRLATNRWDSRTNSEVADWHAVVAFDRQAENCLKYLHKGSAVLIEGRLTVRQWDGQDGKKHSRAEILANRVSFLGRGAGPDPADEARPEPPPPARELKSFAADAVPF